MDYQIGIDEDGYPEFDFDFFLEELQKILPAKEAFMLFKSGHEKLKYVDGYCTVCTKNDIATVSLEALALNKAKELLGEDYTTQTSY